MRNIIISSVFSYSVAEMVQLLLFLLTIYATIMAVLQLSIAHDGIKPCYDSDTDQGNKQNWYDMVMVINHLDIASQIRVRMNGSK